ncbi:MAG: class I SAM-dependent methyltransferase, partial [Prosthecobacter sp.]
MTELDKYKGIYASPAHVKYGHSNHGHEAIDLVTAHMPQRVLDVGCGYGEWGKELKACLPAVEVIGV